MYLPGQVWPGSKCWKGSERAEVEVHRPLSHSLLYAVRDVASVSAVGEMSGFLGQFPEALLCRIETSSRCQCRRSLHSFLAQPMPRFSRSHCDTVRTLDSRAFENKVGAKNVASCVPVGLDARSHPSVESRICRNRQRLTTIWDLIVYSRLGRPSK